MRGRHQPTRSALVALTALLANGCTFAVMNPYLRACDERVVKDPSLDNAVKYAVDTRQKYYDGIRDYTVFNRTAGVVLIGVGAAAAALGIAGGNTMTITELGVGGAALFGTSRVLYSERRLRVYAAGAQAITCAIGVFAPVRAVSPSLKQPLEDLGDGIADLRAAFATLPDSSEVNANPRVQSSRAILVAAQDTYGRAWSLLMTSGARLYDNVEQTRGAVNKALIQDEPDLSEIMATAADSIRTNAGLLTGTTLGAAAPPSKIKQKSRFADQISRVFDIARDVEQRRARVETLLAAMGTAPTSEALKACVLDVEASGLDFRTEPATTVVVDPTSKERKSVIVVRGGKSPYDASWVGKVPGADLDKLVEHSPGGKQGTVTITAATGARNTSYRLSVSDVDGHGKVLDVIVGRGGSSGGGDQPAPIVEAPASDPLIEKAQKSLIAMGCLDPTLPNGGTSADGRWGDQTKAAVIEMAEKQGIIPGTLLVEGLGPDKEGFSARLDQKVAEAKPDTWKNCKITTAPPADGGPPAPVE
jgi:hypothetical protein